MTDTPDPSPAPAALTGPVLVIGVGLIGTSAAQALTQAGHQVHLRDADTSHVWVAASMGAGVADPVADPALVVVAVPPDHLGAVVVEALTEFPDAVVTDTGSVKAPALAYVTHRAPNHAHRYVGGHPMAGLERAGPLAAVPDLFLGRTWAVLPRSDNDPGAVGLVRALAVTCGASVVTIDTDDHDRAVALVSHLPHLVSVLMAGRLAGQSASDLALSGQGVRDVTRVAGGDPGLWRQIVTANAGPLVDLLDRLASDLDQLRAALVSQDTADVDALLASGVAGHRAVPGKHGGPPRTFATVTVAIPDRPGSLARLFADADAAGANVEDVRIDHDPAREYGSVEIDVVQSDIDALVTGLAERGWTAHR